MSFATNPANTLSSPMPANKTINARIEEVVDALLGAVTRVKNLNAAVHGEETASKTEDMREPTPTTEGFLTMTEMVVGRLHQELDALCSHF